MAAYIASRIRKGFLDYDVMVGLYPQLKNEIDTLLK